MRKIWLTLFALGGIIWLGASIGRTVVGFDAFVPGTVELKAAQTDVMIVHTVWLYTLLGGWTGWAFAAATIGGIGCFFAYYNKFKTNGWMMMATILGVILLPAQGWIILQDFRLWSLFDATSGLPLAPMVEILDVFLFRVTDIQSGVVTGLSFLIATSIASLFVWRPLTTTPEQDQENHES